MKTISHATIEQLLTRATSAQRRRAHHNIHTQAADPIQRLFVAAQRDSYIRPHRHPQKWELAIFLKGRFDLLLFDNDGIITARMALGPMAEHYAVELPPATWHASVPMEDNSMFFEVKPGPYDPTSVSEFADWSPAEDTPEAAHFLESMRQAQVGKKIPMTS